MKYHILFFVFIIVLMAAEFYSPVSYRHSYRDSMANPVESTIDQNQRDAPGVGLNI